MKTEGEEEGNGTGELICLVLCLKAFLSLAGGNLTEGLGKASAEGTPQLYRCALSGSWSPLIGQRQGLHCNWFWYHPAGFCCFSGPGAEIQLRPRCYLLDVISREERPSD